jgi:hypothetical protein
LTTLPWNEMVLLMPEAASAGEVVANDAADSIEKTSKDKLIRKTAG